VIVLAVLGALASFAVKDISFAWKLIISVTAGVGSVYIARWYWWRVNAWSEISAMATALVATFALGMCSGSSRFGGAAWVTFPYSTALTAFAAMLVWITVTLLTKPVGRDHLSRFYERCHPGGPGWKAFGSGTPGASPRGSGLRTAFRIACGVAALYLTLFGIGNLVLGIPLRGFLLLAGAFVAGLALYVSMRPPRSAREG
jgi:SSS family solute:Na+ symporter